jgi:hypothetical protein
MLWNTKGVMWVFNTELGLIQVFIVHSDCIGLMLRGYSVRPVLFGGQ